MLIFAIRDNNDLKNKDMAYLIYFERYKRFYIELFEDADPWDTPLLLSSFLKRGRYTLDSFWSALWVQQRIIPLDRQNLGNILKDNGLKEYDEFELLSLARGRCVQDSFYIEPILYKNLPDSIIKRFKKKVTDVLSLNHKRLLIFFEDKKVKIFDLKSYVKTNNSFSFILKDDNLFRSVCIQPGGYGVCWGEDLNISYNLLYETSIEIPLTLEDFRRFVENRVVNTAQASELLGCTRQNIDDLIRRKKLFPIKSSAKNKLYLKSDVMRRI